MKCFFFCFKNIFLNIISGISHRVSDPNYGLFVPNRLYLALNVNFNNNAKLTTSRKKFVRSRLFVRIFRKVDEIDYPTGVFRGKFFQLRVTRLTRRRVISARARRQLENN